MRESAPRVALLSIEPWDEVWRRNQHLVATLVRSGAVSSVVWVSPPRGGLALRSRSFSPMPGVEVVEPPLLVPRRWGGHRAIAVWLRRRLRGVDVVWVNDPVSGAGALRRGRRTVYDVTDDWRSMPQSPDDRRRTVDAEDLLARDAVTVVCSTELAKRWRERYGIEPHLVPNGVDVAAVRGATPQALDGSPPHAVYVGTIHANRLDAALVAELAQRWPGTVHLIGPENLDAATRGLLTERGVRLPGRIDSAQVPAVLVSADVLICPHRVDDFTLSLDAIKAHEYLATTVPVVATPSSGFQALTADGLTVVAAPGFVDAAIAALGSGPHERNAEADWRVRASAFAAILKGEDPE